MVSRVVWDHEIAGSNPVALIMIIKIKDKDYKDLELDSDANYVRLAITIGAIEYEIDISESNKRDKPGFRVRCNGLGLTIVPEVSNSILILPNMID